MVTEKHFTIKSNRGFQETITDRINLTELLLRTYKKTLKYSLGNGNITTLTLPNQYSITLTPLTTNGIQITVYTKRGKVIFENTIYLYKKLNILNTITNTLNTLIEELCKL